MLLVQMQFRCFLKCIKMISNRYSLCNTIVLGPLEPFNHNKFANGDVFFKFLMVLKYDMHGSGVTNTNVDSSGDFTNSNFITTKD